MTQPLTYSNYVSRQKNTTFVVQTATSLYITYINLTQIKVLCENQKFLREVCI